MDGHERQPAVEEQHLDERARPRGVAEKRTTFAHGVTREVAREDVTLLP
jgi:hypothetical protein